ncbi:MAG: hypothetical protein JST83_03965 [Bacteroidetes bacterium]|nr:hypothetical protein [Bacteroidota bacterium]
MDKKKSPIGRAMPRSKQHLYNGGVTSEKNHKKECVISTLTVDSITFQFKDKLNLTDALKHNKCKLTNFNYYIKNSSHINTYAKYAKFYSKGVYIGNLFFEPVIYNRYNWNTLLFQVTKERFYSDENWTSLVLDLFRELEIKKYTIKRIDVALDIETNIIDVIGGYLEKKYEPKSRCKRITRMNTKGELGSIRYTIDGSRKVIAIYRKDCGDLHLSPVEEKLTDKTYKKPEKYQIEYWKNNGLKVNRVVRIEQRLTGKYAKIEDLHLLRDIDTLSALYFKELGNNLTFIQPIATGKRELVALKLKNLLINNQKVSITENVVFKLPSAIRDKIKLYHEKCKSVKVVQTLDEDSGVVDIGDGFRIIVRLNREVKPSESGSFWSEALYSQDDYDKKRPPIHMTKEFIKFEEVLAKLAITHPQVFVPIDPDTPYP